MASRNRQTVHWWSTAPDAVARRAALRAAPRQTAAAHAATLGIAPSAVRLLAARLGVPLATAAPHGKPRGCRSRRTEELTAALTSALAADPDASVASLADTLGLPARRVRALLRADHPRVAARLCPPRRRVPAARRGLPLSLLDTGDKSQVDMKAL